MERMIQNDPINYSKFNWTIKVEILNLSTFYLYMIVWYNTTLKSAWEEKEMLKIVLISQLITD